MIEGAGTVVLIALASIYAVTFPTGTWLSFEPDAIAVVVLLWLTARNQQLFAIAGAFVVSISVIGATTYGIGHFGDVTLPIVERARGSRVVAIMVTAFTLVLSALFAERRRNEAELKQSNNRLQLALDCAELGTWSLQQNTGRFENDVRDRRIHGHGPEAPPKTLAEMRSQVHPDDLPRLDDAFRELRHTGGSCRTEYRLAPRTIQERAGRERWVAMEGTVVRLANGRPEQLLGVTRDITERKHAELTLAERNTQLELASKTARVGSFAIDFRTELVNLSPGCAAILGLPDSTLEISRDNIRKRVHPENLATFDAALAQVFLKKQREFIAQFRIIRTDNADVRWTLLRGVILYDQGGQPLRAMVGIIDFTERKQAELQLAERNAQFGLAQKATRVGTYTYDNIARTMQLSEASAAIFGLPQGTTEITADDWRSRVHPDDVQRLAAERRRAFKERQSELVGELRIVRPTGEVRWIEVRALITYGEDGLPCSMVSVYIDVTERRHAEDHKSLLIAELDHRVKNTLATVSAVVSHTRQGRRSVADFAATLEGRLRSMAATHELLSAHRWLGISLANLVRRELAPYTNRNNIKISGPDVALRPEAGQAIAMVIHELATNAAKYGALSTKMGRVSVRWDQLLNGHPRPDLVLDWQEIGGPLSALQTIRAMGPAQFAT